MRFCQGVHRTIDDVQLRRMPRLCRSAEVLRTRLSPSQRRTARRRSRRSRAIRRKNRQPMPRSEQRERSWFPRQPPPTSTNCQHPAWLSDSVAHPARWLRSRRSQTYPAPSGRQPEMVIAKNFVGWSGIQNRQGRGSLKKRPQRGPSIGGRRDHTRQAFLDGALQRSLDILSRQAGESLGELIDFRGTDVHRSLDLRKWCGKRNTKKPGGHSRARNSKHASPYE